jgi:hypothetical protein
MFKVINAKEINKIKYKSLIIWKKIGYTMKTK